MDGFSEGNTMVSTPEKKAKMPGVLAKRAFLFSKTGTKGRLAKASACKKALQKARGGTTMNMMDRIALILTVVGGVNWGLVGIFRFDLVAWLCGGQATILARVIYTLVAVCALWCMALIFRDREEFREESVRG